VVDAPPSQSANSKIHHDVPHEFEMESQVQLSCCSAHTYTPESLFSPIVLLSDRRMGGCCKQKKCSKRHGVYTCTFTLVLERWSDGNEPRGSNMLQQFEHASNRRVRRPLQLGRRDTAKTNVQGTAESLYLPWLYTCRSTAGNTYANSKRR
jgi:hypothetical protein